VLKFFWVVPPTLHNAPISLPEVANFKSLDFNRIGMPVRFVISMHAYICVCITQAKGDIEQFYSKIIYKVRHKILVYFKVLYFRHFF